MAALAGANLIYGAGMIESGVTFDCGQLVMDNEIARMIKHVVGGIPVSDETLAVDDIAAVGSFGDFLCLDSTLRHMRELSQPTLIDRRVREDWEERGATDLYARSLEKAARCCGSTSRSRCPRTWPRDPRHRRRDRRRRRRRLTGGSRERIYQAGRQRRRHHCPTGRATEPEVGGEDPAGDRAAAPQHARAADIEYIHEQTLRLLADVGVRPGARRAVALLRDAGALVDDETGIARLPGDIVERTLETAPKTVLLAARDRSRDALLDHTRTFVTTRRHGRDDARPPQRRAPAINGAGP